MAKVFLGAQDAYRLFSEGATIFGVAGDPGDKVIIEPDAQNISVNANVARVDFPGILADFTFKAPFGAIMEVFAADGSTLIATIPLQDDDRTQLVFGDGAVDAVYDQGSISVGGETLTNSADAVNPDTSQLDSSVTSGSGQPSDTPVSAKVFLESGDMYQEVNSGAQIFGLAGDDSDAVIIDADAVNISVNANVDRVDFTGNMADFTFKAPFGANMQVFAADGSTLIASFPLQEDDNGTQLVFGDGAVNAIYNQGQIRVGGELLGSTAGVITPEASEINPNITTGVIVTGDDDDDPSMIEESIDGAAFSETPDAFDAGTGSFKFMDDAMVNTNVIIENFSSDDAISISNADVSEYSFSNEGEDVKITLNFNDAGTVTNTIKLTGVVNSDDLVFDQAAFVEAIGFDPFIS